MPIPSNFTQMVTEWRDGDPRALERLTPLVYDELRRLARHYMKSERAHFFALASRLMRRVLVDHAKSRARIKRGAGARKPVTEDTLPPIESLDMIELDEALEGLQQMEPRLAQVIELHYFGGLTYEQIAEAAKASTATVHRDIRLARAWLLNEITGWRST